MKSNLPIPNRHMLIGHVLRSLSNYWKQNGEELLKLPVYNIPPNFEISIPLQLETIKLPEWANDCGVNGQLMVPRECLELGLSGVDWKKVDWWTAIFLLMEGWHERIWEKTHGVIHSYSFKLKDWDTRAWDHAWVNRIAIFLRRWVERKNICKENFMGPLPNAKLILSHDVDAVSKTMPIRLKQGAFNLFNALKCSSAGRIGEAFKYYGKALRMLFGQGNWNHFEELLEMEADAEICAVYHFFADDRRKTLKRWLFDPGYDIPRKELNSLIARLSAAGHEVGLHPAFDSWRDADLIANQRSILEEKTGLPILSCRQHWLRFSWKDTWTAQTKGGIKKDSTLMFNDRPGFRNSSCLSWHPWNPRKSKPHELTAINSVLMDSHLYDYHSFTEGERKDEISCWVEESKKVLGECSFLWHPHTLSQDYGWQGGLKCLLDKMSAI